MTKPCDDDHRLMSLVYPDFIDLKSSSEMSKKVNILLRESKGEALVLMNNILSKYDHNIILDCGASWLKISSAVAFENSENEEVRNYAASTFTLLIKQAAKLPEASRDVANNVVPNIIDRMLQLKKQSLSVLICLNAIMEFFPRASAFKAKRGKICKYLMFMFGLNVEAQELGIKCWSLMFRLGSGGGHDNQIFMNDWQLQMKETVDSMQYYHDVLLKRKEDETACYGHITLPLKKLPPYEPQLSYEATQRFLVLCKCLQALLESASLLDSATGKLPFEQIFNICNNVINSDGKKLTSSTLEFRWEMERSSLQVLNDVITRFSKIRRAQHCELVNNLLRQRVVHLHANYNKKSLKLRALYYDVITRWIEGCRGVFTNFISYENEDLPLIKVMTMDAACASFDQSLTSNSNIVRDNDQQKRSNKKKKKKKSVVDDVTMHCTTVVLFDEDAQVELSCNSLRALRHMIVTFGDVLQQVEHKKCNTHLHKSILDLIQKLRFEEKSTILFQKRPELRKELYCILQSMIIQTNGPISRAITYFNHAANMDSSANVRSFCFEASKIASALIRRPVVRITRRKEDNDESEEDDDDDDEDEKVETCVVACQTEEVVINEREEEENHDDHEEVIMENNNNEQDENEQHDVNNDDVIEEEEDDNAMCTADDVTVNDTVVVMSPQHVVESVAVEEPAAKKRKVSTEDEVATNGVDEDADDENVSRMLAMFYDENPQT